MLRMAELKSGHASQCGRASHCLREMGASRFAVRLAWQGKEWGACGMRGGAFAASLMPSPAAT